MSAEPVDIIQAAQRHISNRAPDPQEAPPPQLIVTSMADVTAQVIRWLWECFIARGKLSILGGHPGIGKSTLTAYIASIISTSGFWPDGTRSPLGNVLFLIAEDDLADTLKPRLDWHGADATRISAIKAVRDGNGKERLFHMEKHLDLLRATIIEKNIDLVVIDPLSSFMARSDRNGEGDVRDLLTPLGQLAGDTDAAILGVMHVGKPSGGSQRTSLQTLLGSTAFGAVARTVMMACQVPQDDDESESDPRHLFGVVKSNIAIKPRPLEWSHPLDSPLVWHGYSQRNIDDVLTGAKEAPVDEAKDFLRNQLKEGSKTVAELKQAMKPAGISWSTLRRAKDAIGVVSFKLPNEMHGPWLWKLPVEGAQSPSTTEAGALEGAQPEGVSVLEGAQSQPVGTFEGAQIVSTENMSTFGKDEEELAWLA